MKHDAIVLSGRHSTEQLAYHISLLRPGGLLFVYGEPHQLPEPATHLTRQLVYKH